MFREGDGVLIQENCCIRLGWYVLMDRRPGRVVRGRAIKAAYERRMRGFAMARERGDMFDNSEKMLMGVACARRRSRKRGDGAASRRKSGSSVFALGTAALFAWSSEWFLTFAVAVGDDLA
jgi:hypothetical protein